MKYIPMPVRVLFAVPWFVVAYQHFIYADFVRTIVPEYLPFRLFWVYFTAVAMIAAGVSIITGIRAQLAARMLACMMLVFLLLIHPHLLVLDPHGAKGWTRFLQDIAIMGAALSFGAVVAAGRYLYAVPVLLLGAQHFWGLEYVTGRIPDWLPLKPMWDYLMGAFIVLAALAILLDKKRVPVARALGIVLLVAALLYHGPLLIANPRTGGDWTGAMLDCMIASGALVLAYVRPKNLITPFSGSSLDSPGRILSPGNLP